MGTAKGETKELVIEQKGNIYFIKYTDGGQLPEELSGLFTSPDIAKQFIQNYKEKKERSKA